MTTTKETVWDILRCCMLWYQGAEPEYYGFDPELSRIGKQLANALFERVERMRQEKENA